MINSQDPLDNIFVDENAEPNRELLASLLQKYIHLTKEGQISLTVEFSDLTHPQKILIILLAKKALYLKRGLEEKASPKDIQTITGMSPGNTNPNLRLLEKERKIIVSEGGKYYVPNYLVPKAAELFR